MNSKIIFLHSLSSRSGHNFVAEVIRICVDVSTPLGLRSEIPFGVFIKNYEDFKKATFGSAHYQEYFDQLFIEDLRSKILKNGNILIKHTSLEGAEEVKMMFPNDIHIVSIRNPVDVLKSVFKGMKFKNNIKSKLKKSFLPFGFYHYWYAKRYTSKIISVLPNLKEFDVFKFEDLVLRKDDTLQKLIDVLDSNISLDDLKKSIEGIKVINTSFYKEETNSKSLWDIQSKTSKFNPINRKETSFIKNKFLHVGLAKLCNKLNY